MTDWGALAADLRALSARYREMHALARRQVEVLARSDWNELEEIVRRKNSLMAEIEAIHARTRSLREKWPQERDGVAPDRRADVEAALQEANRALEELLATEEEGRRALEERRGRAAGEMDQLRRARSARRSYGDAGPSESRFFDSGA